MSIQPLLALPLHAVVKAVRQAPFKGALRQAPGIISQLDKLSERDEETQQLFKTMLQPSLESGLFKFPKATPVQTDSTHTLSPYKWQIPGNTSVPPEIHIVDLYGGLGAIASRLEQAHLAGSGGIFKNPGDAEAYFVSLVANFAGMCGGISELDEDRYPHVVQITWERDAPNNYAIATGADETEFAQFLAIGSTISYPSDAAKELVREAHVKDFMDVYTDPELNPNGIRWPLKKQAPDGRDIGQRLGHCAETMAWITLHLSIKAGKKFHTMALNISSLKEINPDTGYPWYCGIPECAGTEELLHLLRKSKAYRNQCPNCASLAERFQEVYKAELRDISPSEILKLLSGRK
ncbi:hypothetical protein C8R47DRAFT_1080544 [Mycena vitilis]|nr:hypothetical protein C8R47DRAFT_1080544 [Mycena vitilis]